jgi:hypothetical protein
LTLHHYRGNSLFKFFTFSRNDALWGPYSEGSLLYFLNPCPGDDVQFTDSQSASCLTPDGFPIRTACIYDALANVSVDAGKVIGFSISKNSQLVVEFTDGMFGCGNEVRPLLKCLQSQALGTPEVPRKLNLTMVCDPSAGAGTIQGLPGRTAARNGSDACVFDLIWPSIYGVCFLVEIFSNVC